MSTKDEELRVERALKLALESLEETRNALAWFYDSYPQDVTKKGNELLPHVETVLTTIREALASQSEALNAPLADTALERMAENERELGLDYMKPAEIPQSIICPFCESQHVPGWLHDYNMDRMKKPAPATEFREQQSAERGEPVTVHQFRKSRCSDWYDGIPDDCQRPWLYETRTLYTSPPVNANAGKPLTDEQIAVLNFMLGADDLDGVWFGERHPKEKGAFWWRNRLRNAFQDAAIEAKLREKNEHREKNA